MEAIVAQLHEYEVQQTPLLGWKKPISEDSIIIDYGRSSEADDIVCRGLSENKWGSCRLFENYHGIEIEFPTAVTTVDTTATLAQQQPQLKRKWQEEREEYERQVEESGGFDVDDFPHLELAHMIQPVSKSSFKSCYDKIKARTMLAIDHYNNRHQDSKKIEFSQVLKVNYSSYPLKHYSTFEAKASNAADADIDVVNVFQTLIMSAGGDLGFVKFCRRKRRSSPN